MANVRERAHEITHIDVNVQTMADAIVGTRNAHINGPRNIEELQYSLPVQMALSALGKGNGYQTHLDFLEGRLMLTADSEVIEFARKIHLTVSESLDQNYPRHFVADATVHFKDGSSVHLFQERATGSVSRPYPAQQFQAKLEELTNEVLGKPQADKLFGLVDAWELTRPVRDVTALLRR
jgi:2-methylcitrate dehydratase PrpD